MVGKQAAKTIRRAWGRVTEASAEETEKIGRAAREDDGEWEAKAFSVHMYV